MRKRSLLAAAGLSVSVLALAACGSNSTAASAGASGSASSATSPSTAPAKPKVGVILPDSASSARWETNDRPLLTAAFTAAGVDSDIQNANGDVTKFQSIADQMINEKVNVLLIVNLDSASGAAVEAKAKAANIPTVDYDRLTLGGSASYYVSFDNVAVGTTIGTGLVKCMQAQGHKTGAVIELDGSPTDNNATLFHQGYDKVIKDAGYTVAVAQAVPGWDNVKGGTIFENLFSAHKNIVGVASANDGLGGAAEAILAKNGVAGKILVTGQDATDEGLQRVLAGTQCLSVYKAIKKEADAASAISIALAKKDTATADGLATGSVQDTTANRTVKSVLLTPEAIYANNVEDVVKDNFTTAAKLCTTPALQAACTKNGVS
jgi:D-xylose transport system substrate-binding protein